jgi:rhodanese-related sulfurtransferase
MTMKRLFPILALLFVGTGCDAQSPDNLKEIPPTELNRIMQGQDIFLVDVHTPEQRHIKGTDRFIPYDQIEKFKDQLPQDKDAPIYLYCESGRMARTAAKALNALGYRNLFNLDGGEAAWRKSGLPLE